jgi:hypothetical protein
MRKNVSPRLLPKSIKSLERANLPTRREFQKVAQAYAALGDKTSALRVLRQRIKDQTLHRHEQFQGDLHLEGCGSESRQANKHSTAGTKVT